MIAILMPLYMACGFVAHLTRSVTTEHMRQDWREISNYSLGVLYVFPLASLMFHSLKGDIKNPMLRFAVAYLLSFLSFGVGVVAGFRYTKPSGIAKR